VDHEQIKISTKANSSKAKEEILDFELSHGASKEEIPERVNSDQNSSPLGSPPKASSSESLLQATPAPTSSVADDWADWE